MEKNATLLISPSLYSRGTYANPVSVLNNEEVEYAIKAVNTGFSSAPIIIRDTLPAYMNYVSAQPPYTTTAPLTNPPRTALSWTLTGIPAQKDTVVRVKATPQAGSVASQPLFINRAWVKGDTLPFVPTNYTYHQGAGASVMTFSAGFGGHIFHAEPQAVDYRSTARPGVLIVPDAGYSFTGWSHPGYTSKRGASVQAQSGIMHYDTMTIYGDLNLHASFALENYPITYHLHDGAGTVDGALNNPASYTVESETFTLIAPVKAGDEFVGWTGSNGDTPQLTVTIPRGSTGNREYYANYLHSGRSPVSTEPIDAAGDRIWAYKGELYVRTSTPGGILRVYSAGGILIHQQILLQPGETKIKLAVGVYVVTLNNAPGRTLIIN
jgi:uncharacterized repeat protein (TIGR02543 family)